MFRDDGTLTGADIMITNIFADKLGFAGFRFVKTKIWGAQIGDTGAWSGTIGAVKNGTATLGFGHVIIQYFRYQVSALYEIVIWYLFIIT